MATTVNVTPSHAFGGLNMLELDLTAGAADTAVTYTLLGKPKLKFVGVPWNVTTSVVAVGTFTYTLSTGVISVSCANSDNVRVTVGF